MVAITLTRPVAAEPPPNCPAPAFSASVPRFVPLGAASVVKARVVPPVPAVRFH